MIVNKKGYIHAFDKKKLPAHLSIGLDGHYKIFVIRSVCITTGHVTRSECSTLYRGPQEGNFVSCQKYY